MTALTLIQEYSRKYRLSKKGKASQLKYERTKRGLTRKIFMRQVGKCKKTGRCLAYGYEWLFSWATSQDAFEVLYRTWVESGYLTSKIPTVDRKNSGKGYTKTNIQLMSWEDNAYKRMLDMADNPTKRNKSGVTGVGWDKAVNKWWAQITINGKNTNLGRFIDKEDAIQVRKKAEKKYWGVKYD